MQSIKTRLLDYLDLIESNDREIARYEELENNGATKEDLDIIKAEIIASTEKEVAEKENIKNAISRLPSSIQQQLMTYRYIDRLDWSVVIKILYHTKDDYNDNWEKYKRKAFKVHNRAIKYICEKELM